MKKFLAMLVILIIVLTVMAGALAMGIFIHITTPKPLESYPYTQQTGNITAIDIAVVSDTSSGDAVLTRAQAVEDIDAFLADFAALECTAGINLDKNLLSGMTEGLRAIKITYSDDSFEIITAIGNLDSSIVDSGFTPDKLLSREWCYFDEAEFNALLDKYTTAE